MYSLDTVIKTMIIVICWISFLLVGAISIISCFISGYYKLGILALVCYAITIVVVYLIMSGKNNE